MGEIADDLRAAQAYAAHYFAAQIDRVKVAFRNVAILMAVGVLALVGGVAVIVMSVVLLCVGVSGGLSRLYGGIPWLGDLSTGLLILVFLFIGVKIALAWMSKVSRKQMVASFERRKSQQRAQYGADVHGRGEN
jgi:hypothetical protein